jgi:outer membrane protein TolC
MMKKYLIFILLLVTTQVLAQQERLSLDDCRQLALKHNKKIAMADENRLMVHSIGKSTQTMHYPKFNLNGGYVRMNKEFSLLSDDVYLPVIPSGAMVNGQFDPSTLQSDPDLMRQTLVTQDVMGFPIPVLDENGNYIFQNYSYLPKDAATLGIENLFLLNLGMTQPIYTGGKIKELNKLVDYGEDLMVAKKEMTESEVVIETDERYWQVISLKEKVKLTNIYKGMLENLLGDLNNIYEEGIITKNDILKAKVKYNEIDLKLLKSQNGLKLAQMALNQTLGFPLDTVVELSDSIVLTIQIPDKKEMTQLALENRPEIDMVNSTIKMAQSGEKILRSRYLPNIGLTANYMFTNPNPYNGFKEEFGGDWNVGVIINVPIWNWNEHKHSLDAMKHKTRSIELKYEETKELISLEVQKTLFKYHESLKKVEMTRVSLEQAEENLKITEDSFKEGILKTTDLLEAQTMWQSAFSEYIEAKTENKLCESELLRVSGQLNY